MKSWLNVRLDETVTLKHLQASINPALKRSPRDSFATFIPYFLIIDTMASPSLRKIFGIISFLVVATNAEVFAQSICHSSWKAAQEMINATINGNGEAVISYTHPKVIEAVGGVERMKAIINSTKSQIAAQGMELVDQKVTEILASDSTSTSCQCLLSTDMSLRTSNGKLVSKSYLYGISTNKGSKWYFISISGKSTSQQLKTIEPLFSDKIPILQPPQPIFYRD